MMMVFFFFFCYMHISEFGRRVEVGELPVVFGVGEKGGVGRYEGPNIVAFFLLVMR